MRLFFKRSWVRSVARVMILVMFFQLVIPATKIFALTSGPSQPEVQSFEPVGTTDMVDLFTGDFVYNIPLMDVEGYPINISYHTGINIEQESSWVGLGWNINPGEINRSVRGIPDDFNGEEIQKKLNINPEQNIRLNAGVGVGFEFFGALNLGLSIGGYVSYNNYRGMGVGLNTNVGVSTPIVSTGLGVSVGSMEGADVDVSAGLRFSTSTFENGSSGSISFNGSTGFNTRSGLKNISYGVTSTFTAMTKSFEMFGRTKTAGVNASGISYGSSIPIGLQNYVAVVTNPTTLKAWAVQIKAGMEIFYGYPNMNIGASVSNLTYTTNGTRPSYGYLYSQNATDQSIMDFSREKDGIYNSTLPNLPFAGMDYDIYSISGQGTGGMFRPFRNDIGTVFDPYTQSQYSSSDATFEFGAPLGPIGGLFEFGTDVKVYDNKVESGPWFMRNFKGKQVGKMYENTFFKQAGEMTYNLVQKYPMIADHNPVYMDEKQKIRSKSTSVLGTAPSLYSGVSNRSPRANYLNFVTNEEAEIRDVATRRMIENYPKNLFYNNNQNIGYSDRLVSNKVNRAKKSQIAEMTQILPDGRRYVYGLPVMNNIQKEVTFSVKPPQQDNDSGIVSYQPQNDGVGNTVSREHFFQSSVTPAYAHSYLLTEVLSQDYSDITGDGATEDDIGSYTRFNYSLVDDDYRWRAPYSVNEELNAQYIPGYWSDKDDDKAQYILGSKEVRHLHSIETKNFIAEFYISTREDGKGVKHAIKDVGNVDGFFNSSDATNNSYKLDSIKLFSKQDRFINKQNATPIKTVIFQYDYSLCPSTPNSTAPNGGKLTLKKIFFRYGKTDKSLLSPYVFNYSSSNKPYSFANKDRWGNYKENAPDGNTSSNYEFPYVKQNKTEADLNASNWLLTQINLPSGGTLNIKYESDAYSYVQNKRTMEMFKIEGVGSSESFAPKDVLYESVDNSYDYVYFKRDISREEPGRSFKDNYLENSYLLYFSFNLDIAARNRYENIKGYAKVEKIDVCSDNNQYGYVKLARVPSGGKSNKLIHPIALAGLNIGRFYLPHIIYPGYQPDGPNPLEMVRGLMASSKELMSIWQNANVRFIKDGLAKKIKPAKSWIRLNTPGYTKMGGGSRVKSLVLNNSWSTMTSSGSNATYGKIYDYTSDDPQHPGISSGVASYEPLIGGDENPLHKPIDYIADAGKLLPAIEFYQEEPLGESFYPSPIVGYSRVSVKSIHAIENSRSSKAEDVYEFYTAKDFPIEVAVTPKDTRISERHKTLRKELKNLAVAQGYTLIMNDMHGKVKSVSNYVLKGDNKELITAIKYNYQTDSRGKLNNKVKALVRSNNNITDYANFSVNDVVLGEEVDFTVDNRKRNMESYTSTVSFNLNVVNFLFVVVPIPTLFFPDKTETDLFQTMVSTKIVQQYGILKSVETIDHGARSINENVLYDGETGQVLLSRMNNEFNDPITNINYPAYWAYENMGPSYYNVGYEAIVDTLYISNDNIGHLIGIDNKKCFNPGDELLVKYKVGSSSVTRKLWATGYETIKIFLGYDTLYRPCSDCINSEQNPTPFDNVGEEIPIYSTAVCALTVEPRAASSTGDMAYPWHLGGTIGTDVHIKVLRSGKRNQLDKSVQNIALARNVAVNTFGDLFGSQINKVLNTSVSKYDQSTDPSSTIILENNYRYNKYVKGLAGNFRESEVYAYLSNRDYGTVHTRKDGVISNYSTIFQLASDSLGNYPTICDPPDNFINFGNYSNWKSVKLTTYNQYGFPVMERDASSMPSSVLYGYNNILPIAIASNASNKQVVYYNFEDLITIRNTNSKNLKISPTIPTYITPSTIVSYGNNGKNYFTYPNNVFAANSMITQEAAHTGLNSIKFANPGNIYLGKLTDFGTTPYYYISMWVKPISPSTPNAGHFLLNALNGGNTITYTYQVFNVVTTSIDGWYKLEGKIDMPTTTSLSIRIPRDVYVDDIRFYPDNANMKSYAYNPTTLKLMAELDENNFATFYEYDQEGLLIRVKKETQKGILTVSENRRSTKKENN